MKKSINVWSFPFDWSLEKKLNLAKDAGFSGFEIDLSEEGPVNLKSTPKQLTKIRRQADAAGLQLTGLATGLYWGANPASADKSVRLKAAEILNRQINCASALGLDAILVVPGAVGVDFIPNSEVVSYELAFDRAQQFISAALKTAEAKGVTLCLENVWNKFLLSPLEMRDFIDRFQSERVASYFDVGNALITGYPQHWVNILGKRIRRVHFKDFKRRVGTIEGFCDLLAGDVDWPEVVRALAAIAYDGWVTAEMIPPVPFYKHGPEILIENTSRAMDAILTFR